MRKPQLPRLVLAACLLLGNPGWASAQVRSSLPASITAVPIRSLLGDLVSDSLPASRMKSRLGDSLLVFRQGRSLHVLSFRFGYEHPEVYRNDTTGALEVFHSYKNWTFQGPRLDTLWEHYLQRNLSQGDMLYFDRILARSPQDTLYMAPPLKFDIIRP